MRFLLYNIQMSQKNLEKRLELFENTKAYLLIVTLQNIIKIISERIIMTRNKIKGH